MSKVKTNISLAKEVIGSLYQSGVREFVLAAGARNAPLVHLLTEGNVKPEPIQTWSFFEERSAAFFALGRIKESQRPVAVVTTSGTAVAECLPAVIEAYYSGLPLIVLSADRPKRFRGTASPQVIEQKGIFSVYTKSFEWDLDSENWNTQRPLISHSISTQGPGHINVCFEEPLIDEDMTEAFPVDFQVDKKNNLGHGKDVRLANEVKYGEVKHQPENLAPPASSFKKPLIILSGLPEWQRSNVEALLGEFTSQEKIPIYAEGLSGLRESLKLKECILQSGELFLSQLFKSNHCDSVIRIGAVPTCRLWRDLEGTLGHIPVISFSPLEFSGLSRGPKNSQSLDALKAFLNEALQCIESDFFEPVKKQDQRKEAKINALHEKHPLSEPSWVKRLSEMIPEGAKVFLGSSLPIREWDLCATKKFKNLQIEANRGANGIDGVVSTFLGWAHQSKESWLILGDLSALYDLSSLWALRELECENLRIVIINNGGAQIFKRIFNSKVYENAHEVDFSHWAKLWSLNYQKISEVSDFSDLPEGALVLELKPNNEQTHAFFKGYESLCQ